jgi:hypothetical protein
MKGGNVLSNGYKVFLIGGCSIVTLFFRSIPRPDKAVFYAERLWV